LTGKAGWCSFFLSSLAQRYLIVDLTVGATKG